MEKLSLNRFRELLRYDAETGHLIWLSRPETDFATTAWAKQWQRRYEGKTAGYVGRGSLGYVVICIGRRTYLGHRIAWALHFGGWPKGQIDHINGDRSDNRISNLRDVPPVINSRNCSIWKTNNSGVLGVCFFEKTGRWRATIGRGPGAYIGMFDTRDEAVAARKAAEARLGYHPNHGRAA